jgi:pimeloyl-ACP methyl ester carboxylesterase
VSELLGLTQLLVAAVVAVVLILSLVIARDALRPPRHTAGYAVARGLPVDPGDLGLEFDQWTLDRPDGAALPVWEIEGRQRTADGGPPRPQGRGRPRITATSCTAVFVHDWGESRIDVLGRLEPWDGLCRRLVLGDMRGHGDATGGPSRLGHREDQDLLSLLERLGDGPFLLVGHAMGASIAITAAAQAPPEIAIAGVVASGPRCEFGASLRSRLRAAGFPARPLADLAMAWLWLRGVRRVDVQRAEAALTVPLLAVDAAAAPARADARRFLTRCGAQVEPAASASSSGPR